MCAFVPGCHHHRLPLPDQGKRVRDPPLLLAFSDLEKTKHAIKTQLGHRVLDFHLEKKKTFRKLVSSALPKE